MNVLVCPASDRFHILDADRVGGDPPGEEVLEGARDRAYGRLERGAIRITLERREQVYLGRRRLDSGRLGLFRLVNDEAIRISMIRSWRAAFGQQWRLS